METADPVTPCLATEDCPAAAPLLRHPRQRLPRLGIDRSCGQLVMARPSPAGFGISGFWVRQAPTRHTANRARWSVILHYRIASLQGWIAVDQCGPCRHHRSEVVGGLISHPPARPWAESRHARRGAPALASGLGWVCGPPARLTDLARSIAERDAQQKSWHWLDGAGALWSDDVIQAALRLRSAARARAHTSER